MRTAPWIWPERPALDRNAPAAPLRQRRDTLFLLGVLALIVGHLTLLLPLWASIFSTVLLVWRAGIAWLGKPLPPRNLLIFLLFTGLVGCVAEVVRTSVSGAALTLLMLLICLKTLEMHARRDLFVLFFLGFFGIVANFLFAQSIPVAVLMLAAFFGLLTALVNAHNPVGMPPLKESARTAASLLLLGMPVIIVLYIAFPRFPPLWSIPTNQNNTARSGLSDSMQVGDVASLAQDQSVAMRIRFLPGSPVPKQGELYFRGPVFSRLDGNRWNGAEQFNTSLQAPAGSPVNPIEPQGKPFRYEVLLEPHQQRWLLPLDATQNPPQSDYPAHMTQELVWYSYRPVTAARRYTAESYSQYQNARLMPAPLLQRYLQLPAGDNPRTTAWAQQLRQQFGTDPAGNASRALIEYALTHLRNEAYHYTLEPGLYGEHAADEFWFDRREGFCEHIASAFAILLRAADIPARIVTGYQGGEANPVNGVWTVRQSDAHAWVEAWLPETGWMRIDPTAAIAPHRIALSRSQALNQGGMALSGWSAAGPTWLWNVRTLMEAIDYRWSQWVLNYNQQSQATLLERLGLSRLNWSQILVVTIGMLCLSALAYLGWPWLRKRRANDPWLALLHHVRQRLHRAGLPLPASTPPRAMAQQVTDFFGPAGLSVAQWLLEMDQYRYAASRQTPSQASSRLKALTRKWKKLPWPPEPQSSQH